MSEPAANLRTLTAYFDGLEGATMLREAADAIEALERERDEAVADNAALLGAIRDFGSCSCNNDYKGGAPHREECRQAAAATVLNKAIASPDDHPGAALLAELARLEAVMSDCVVCRLSSTRRKAR